MCMGRVESGKWTENQWKAVQWMVNGKKTKASIAEMRIQRIQTNAFFPLNPFPLVLLSLLNPLSLSFESFVILMYNNEIPFLGNHTHIQAPWASKQTSKKCMRT